MHVGYSYTSAVPCRQLMCGPLVYSSGKRAAVCGCCMGMCCCILHGQVECMEAATPSGMCLLQGDAAWHKGVGGASRPHRFVQHHHLEAAAELPNLHAT